MLVTIAEYSRINGKNYHTVYGYIVRRKLIRPDAIIGGIWFIEHNKPLPNVQIGWMKGKPRKKRKSDFDILE